MKDRIREILIFAYLILFPFGQLASARINLFGVNVPLHVADIIVGILAVSVLLGKNKYPGIFKYLNNFLWVLIFSFLFSFAFFAPNQMLVGGLYLVRIIAYGLFFVAVYDFIRGSDKRRTFLFSSLTYISFFIAIFGLFQYFFYPDVRAFTIWGWDDHLYRLVGNFLDPGFSAIFLVFGFLATLAQISITKDKKLILVLGILLFSLAVTYSRAGYIALLAGVSFFLLAKNNLKKIIYIAIPFILFLILIPSYGSEGVRLGRVRSIFARVENYSQASQIFTASPVFGIGYNNICIAKEKYLGAEADYQSHSCSGFDASLLVVLVSSGIVGLMVFLDLIIKLFTKVPVNTYSLVFKSSLVALLFNSLFINSLFYPWVMGFMGILLAVSLKEKS